MDTILIFYINSVTLLTLQWVSEMLLTTWVDFEGVLDAICHEENICKQFILCPHVYVFKSLYSQAGKFVEPEDTG